LTLIKIKDLPIYYAKIPLSKLEKPIKNFIGRNSILNDIKESINSSKNKIFIIIGHSGSGKSTLINYLLNENFSVRETNFAYWMNSDEGKFKFEFQQFAELLKVNANNDENELINDVYNVLERLNKITRIFLIFDNCESWYSIKKYFNLDRLENLNIFAFITTRNCSFTTSESLHVFQSIYLNCFDRSECFDYLRLNLIVNAEKGLDLKSYLDLIRVKKRPYDLLKLVANIKLNYFPKKSNFNVLEKLAAQKNLWDVLKLISFMDSDFIPVDLISIMIKIEDKTLETLEDLALISITKREYSIGYTVLECFQSEIKKFLESKRNNRQLLECKQNLISVLEEIFNDKNISTKKVFYRSIRKTMSLFLSNSNLTTPIKKASLFFKFAEFCMYWKDFSEAIGFYKKLLKLNKSLIMNSNEGFIHSFSNEKILHFIGNAYYMQADHGNALEFFNKSLKINQETSIIAKNLFFIGMIYKEKVMYQESLNYLNKILNIQAELNDNIIIKANETIGNIYKKQGKYYLAMKYFEDCLKLIETGSENNEMKFHILKMIGDALRNQGKYEMAIEHYNKILSSQINSLEIDILNGIALVYCDQGKYDLSLEYYNKSMDVYRKLLDDDNDDGNLGIAKIISCIGKVLTKQKKYDLALENFEKALILYEKHSFRNCKLDIAFLFNNMGSIYNALKNFELALDYYKRSYNLYRTLFESNKHTEIAILLNNIASVHCNQGNYHLALSFYLESLKCLENIFRNENHSLIAGTLNNIGLAHKNLGYFKTAIVYFERALKMEENIFGSFNHPNIARTLNNMASVSFAEEDYNKAISYYEKSFQINRKIYPNGHAHVAITLNNIANVYKKQNNLRLALEYFDMSLHENRNLPIQDYMNEAKLCDEIASIHFYFGDYQKALSFYEESLKCYFKIKLEISHGLINNLQENIIKCKNGIKRLAKSEKNIFFKTQFHKIFDFFIRKNTNRIEEYSKLSEVYKKNLDQLIIFILLIHSMAYFIIFI